MIRRIIIIFAILFGLLIIPAALGSDNKVLRGGTVYIGEADLDLSDCNVRSGDEIAWWDSGNPQGTPTARGRVEDASRFTVDPDTFRGHTGQWYGLISKKPVFLVEEPFIQFDLQENGIDTEPDSIKRGNLVSFKISTNLAGLSKRAGSSGATVSINMSGPNETEYHTLSSTRTNEFNLDKVFVYTTPYDTGVVWDTSDQEKFPDGEYTFSATTNVNRINEIFPESGVTYTDKKTIRLGKTETKPTAEPTKKQDKESKDKNELSAEEKSTPTPTETSDHQTRSDKKSVSDSKTAKETDEPTPEETTEEKSSKEVKETKKTSKEVTTEPTPEETQEGKSGKKKVTITPTETSTPEDTGTPTPEVTAVSTPEQTQEPVSAVTPHTTRAPLPHPPAPGASASASPTQASPLPTGIILAALGVAGCLAISRMRQ